MLILTQTQQTSNPLYLELSGEALQPWWLKVTGKESEPQAPPQLPLRAQFYVWLGEARDEIPPERVRELQELIKKIPIGIN